MLTGTIDRSRAYVRLIALALAVATMALVGPASGAVRAQANDGAQADDGGTPRTISVAGTGFAEAEPDEASIRLGVSARGATAQRATSRAATAMQSVIASLQGAGIDEADIKTTRLELNQVRRRDPETGTREPAGWQVRNRVSATITDVERIGEIVDAAIAAGATDVERLQFSASDPSAALAEAREAAVAAASLTAEQLASAAGISVGEVLSIQEGSGSAGIRTYGDSVALEAASLAGPTPVLPGTIDIGVTVYVVYAID